MGKPKRGPNLFVHGNVSDAAQDAVLDGIDAGFTIDDIIGENAPKIRAESEFNQDNLNELVNLKSQGAPIPGQSLVNNPDTPYPWETPPDITNPKEALESIVEDIMQPDAVKNIVSALAGGLPVGDIAMAILYAKFVDGIITVDLLMLLAEPVMYLIMAIGEEANIKYNIEGNDLDEFDDEDKFDKNLNPVEQIKKETLDKPINENSVPQNLLDKVKEQGPEIRSMLSRGEE
tara:strand:+ start:1151 stop:1846 length:696 start_codon:yes stop_codon:yes gene_type:complete